MHQRRRGGSAVVEIPSAESIVHVMLERSEQQFFAIGIEIPEEHQYEASHRVSHTENKSHRVDVRY